MSLAALLSLKPTKNAETSGWKLEVALVDPCLCTLGMGHLLTLLSWHYLCKNKVIDESVQKSQQNEVSKLLP